MQCFIFAGIINKLQDDLRLAIVAKDDAELLANNADSVDKSVIQALRAEANDHQQMVKNLLQH